MARGGRQLAAAFVVPALLLAIAPADAQEPDTETRAGVIEQAQAEKAQDLHPYVPTLAEKYLGQAETILTTGMRWHPYFVSAYSGGGFTMGAGYRAYVGSYDSIDVRGSFTPSGYKRIESEFLAPRLFDRQGELSILGGWREATEVGFYGTGTGNTEDDRANYGFKQPYGQATLTLRPAHRIAFVRGSLETSQWAQTPGSGSYPSVESVYTPETLPGLGATVNYVHPAFTVGLDSRAAADYARRGGYLGVTFDDFSDPDRLHGFAQWSYEAIEHLPILREAWVLSLHGLVSTTGTKSGEEIPFFMLPSVGGGSSLRAYSSWRFRDRNSLELQADWRIMVNRFVDTAVFFDAGKVTARTTDLNLRGLRTDGGFGVRFHGPVATPLRIDFAYGGEGFSIVWAASAAF